jgi:hypothetical protein
VSFPSEASTGEASFDPPAVHQPRQTAGSHILGQKTRRSPGDGSQQRGDRGGPTLQCPAAAHDRAHHGEPTGCRSVMGYRISYLDRVRARRLVALAETLTDSQTVVSHVQALVPQTADRLVIAEDPLLGVGFQVIQSPQSLDAAVGLSVIYLAGTIWSPSNWQAQAIHRLSQEPCIIVNPRREQPPADDEQTLDQVAWQSRTSATRTSRCSGSTTRTPTRWTSWSSALSSAAGCARQSASRRTTPTEPDWWPRSATGCPTSKSMTASMPPSPRPST